MQWHRTIGCVGLWRVVLFRRPLSDTSRCERSVEALLFDENLSYFFSRRERNKKTQFGYHKDANSLAKGKSFEGLRSVEDSWKTVQYGEIGF